MMRPASRAAAAPALPVSISSDSPEGATNKVEFPPSTSITYISSVFDVRVCAAAMAHANIAMENRSVRRCIAVPLPAHLIDVHIQIVADAEPIHSVRVQFAFRQPGHFHAVYRKDNVVTLDLDCQH